MNTITNNNPIGKLQERFQSRNVLPKYSEVPPTDSAPFRMQVEVFDKVAFGSGPTKKQAKSEAATQMLLQLDGKGQGKQKGASNWSPVTSSGDANIDNPVGRLQEFCVTSKLPMPSYTDEEKRGSDHMPTFVVSCNISTMHKTSGTGSSKQAAKTQAAEKMFMLVRGAGVGSNVSTRSSTPNGFGSKSPATNMELSSQSPDSTRSSSSLLHSVGHRDSPSSSSLLHVGHSPDSGTTSWLRLNDFGNQSLDDSLNLDMSRPIRVAARSVRTVAPSEAKEIGNFFNNLNTSASKLENLLKTSLISKQIKPKQTLDDISKEQSFTVIYIDLDKTERGDFQSLVQISTMPVFVSSGVGIDQESAENHAALMALYYFKTMVTKSED